MQALLPDGSTTCRLRSLAPPLKPVAISVLSCSKAEVVECPGRRPCRSADGSRWLLTVGSKRASITFAARQWSEIRSAKRSGLAWFRDLDDFQIDGILQNVVFEKCSEVFNCFGSKMR